MGWHLGYHGYQAVSTPLQAVQEGAHALYAALCCNLRLLHSRCAAVPKLGMECTSPPPQPLLLPMPFE